MPSSTRSRSLGLASALLLISSVIGAWSGSVLPASATGGTWWVSQSGNPVPGNGTDCSNPDFVGSDHSPIQAALSGAADGETVHICSGTYQIGQTVTVSAGVTISGNSPISTVLDGGVQNRIMSIEGFASPTINVTIEGLQFRNGRATGTEPNGAAIKADTDSILTITNSYFRDNRADGSGGAVAMNGETSVTDRGYVQVHNSSFFGNHSGGGGAVSFSGLDQISEITNSTFVENTSSQFGGAVDGSHNSVRATSSTFLDNFAPSGGLATHHVEVRGSLLATSQNTNIALCHASSLDGSSRNVATDTSCLSGTPASSFADLQIRFFAPWGGDTPTVAIGADSDAIDATASCPTIDQRGVNRTNCDAGSFEYVNGAPSLGPNRVSVEYSPGVRIPDYGAPTLSALVSPTFRIATEVGPPLPSGLQLNPGTGLVDGTLSSFTSTNYVVVTAKDSSGGVASMRVDFVPICGLEQDSDGSLLIHDRSDLAEFEAGACAMNRNYRQTANIAWNAPWSPVGSASDSFSGTYNGGGFSISGLDINGGSNAAFIGRAVGATVSALTLDVDVTGLDDSGGVIGYSEGTALIDVRTTGSVVGTSTAGSIGGLVGELYGASIISRSSFEGTVSSPGGTWIGGLVGYAEDSVIENSHFSGAVTGNDEVGGLAGYVDNTEISNTRVVADLRAISPSAYLGGLLSSNEQDPANGFRISNSLADVSLSAGAFVGGLFGWSSEFDPTNSFIESTFWFDRDRFPTVSAIAEVGGFGYPQGVGPDLHPVNSDDLRDFDFYFDANWPIVNGWENSSTSMNAWGICDGETLPFLLWEYTSDPCVQQSPDNSNSPGFVPTPSLPSTPPSGSNNSGDPRKPFDPVLQPGQLVASRDGQEIDIKITWLSETTVVVTAGESRFTLAFERDPRRALRRGLVNSGSPVALAVMGLQPQSAINATLFSTPISLGSLAVDPSGAALSSIMIPAIADGGVHRLRLETTDKDGRALTLWIGLEISERALQLPVTGDESDTLAVIAVWLMIGGVGLCAGVRRRTAHPSGHLPNQ